MLGRTLAGTAPWAARCSLAALRSAACCTARDPIVLDEGTLIIENQTLPGLEERRDHRRTITSAAVRRRSRPAGA